MLTVEDCNATTSAIRAGFVQVVVSVGCSLVEYEVIQGFCHVSVRQRMSRLLSVINSLRMRLLLFSDRVLNRASFIQCFLSGWDDLGKVRRYVMCCLL